MERAACDAVVVGAGLAGAATAWHLARLGLREVVVLEQEPLAGTHASGRNAAMLREAFLPPALARLAAEGARFLRQPPPDFDPVPAFRACGALLLADEAEAAELRAWVAGAGASGVEARWIGREQVEQRVPALGGGSFVGAAECPADGVVDVAALLQGFLRGATRGGARVLTGQRVGAIETERGRVTAVRTDAARFATPLVVDAAGAWAAQIARLAGASELPLRPCRRHLYVSEPVAGIEAAGPIVWNLSQGFYFRPEPPGLLLSPCDESEQAPGEAQLDPAVIELLARKLERHAPLLAGLRITHGWAGLRTLTPDGNFVLGADPRLEGFVWCAGLGGHGVTASAAAGRIAAEAALGRPTSPEHAPARLLAR